MTRLAQVCRKFSRVVCERGGHRIPHHLGLRWERAIDRKTKGSLELDARQSRQGKLRRCCTAIALEMWIRWLAIEHQARRHRAHRTVALERRLLDMTSLPELRLLLCAWAIPLACQGFDENQPIGYEGGNEAIGTDTTGSDNGTTDGKGGGEGDTIETTTTQTTEGGEQTNDDTEGTAGETAGDTAGDTGEADDDWDGYPGANDCDDNNDRIYPDITVACAAECGSGTHSDRAAAVVGFFPRGLRGRRRQRGCWDLSR